MGSDNLTRGELIQFLEGYCAGRKYCIILEARCKLLDTYCGGMMCFSDLPTQKLKQIYNYAQDRKEDIEI